MKASDMTKLVINITLKAGDSDGESGESKSKGIGFIGKGTSKGVFDTD